MSDLDFWSGGILHRLFKARLLNFNRAILRACLALASLYPCFWHLPAVPTVSTFPVGRSQLGASSSGTKET